MSDTAKGVVRGFYESYNDRDLDRTWEMYVAPDLINHAFGGAYDRDAWRASEKSLLAAFPDLRVQVLDQVSEDNKVATRFSMTGTQTAEFFGVPAGGATATLTGTALDRIADGQIVEHWTDADISGFLQQLAATSAS